MPDKESRGRGKDDDAPKKDIEAKGKKARTEKKKSGQDEQRQRLKDLRREAEEAKESSKRTREAAEHVVGEKPEPEIEKEADSVQQGDGAKEVGDLVVGKAKNGIIISGIIDPSQIEPENIKKIVGEAGYKVEFEVPAGFESKTLKQKLDWYKNHGVRIALPIAGGARPPDDHITPLNPVAGPAELHPFVRDMQEAIDPAINAPMNVSLDRLKGIEEDMDDAVRSGPLDGTNADVIAVRRALRVGIESLERQVREQMQEEHDKTQGFIDFNEHFGDDYHNTKRCIESIPPDAGGLRTNLEWAGAWAGNIVNKPAIDDPENENLWPSEAEMRRSDIRKFFEINRAIGQEIDLNGKRNILLLLQSAGLTADQSKNLLELFVSTERGVNLKHRVNNFFQSIYANIGEKRQDAIAGDIKENAVPATTSISQGWVEFNPRMKKLFDVVEQNNLTGKKAGLREWRGMFTIEGVEANVKFAKLTQAPDHWEDIPEALQKLIIAVEPSGLSPDDLSATIQGAYNMLTRINTDTDYGRAMHFEMKEMLEAFKFKQSMIITAHIKSLDPASLQQVFAQIEGNLESTFTNMIARFARDSRGRRWFIKEINPDTHALEDKQFNMFDESKRLYSERLREDRIKMNMVEEMTKYSLDALDIGEIQRAVGYETLPDEWRHRIEDEREYSKYGLGGAWRDQTKWDVALESTRKWLKDRRDKILADPKTRTEHPSWYDAAGNPTAWAKGKMRKSLTKQTIQDWYERKTLHGAYGVVDEDGIDEIAGRVVRNAAGNVVRVELGELSKIFKKTGRPDVADETDAEVVKRMREMFSTGITWQQLRRAEMRQRLRNRLGEMHLNVDTNLIQFGDQRGVKKLKELNFEDLDDLLKTAYVGAVDSNAYDLTWLFEWSDNQFIHIYGKGVGGDDYKALVVNRSSDNYNALIVDHNWEFLHEDFEDRGRGRPGDINEAFKKHFPGKHKWFFGHVSMGARFISGFLTPEDTALIKARTQDIKRRGFDHYREGGPYKENYDDFLEGVAKRELIAEGAISFADKRFSEVVADRDSFNKYNPIDNAADRALVLKFMGAGMIQSYLANPEAASFEKMTTKEDNFMSTRNPRLFPWMEFGIRAHWDVVHNLKYKMFGEPDITNKEMENFTENLVAGGHMEVEQGEEFIKEELGMAVGTGALKRASAKLLGTAFFREIRAFFEDEKKESQVLKKPLWLRLLILFLWTIPFSTAVGLGKGAGEELKKQK